MNETPDEIVTIPLPLMEAEITRKNLGRVERKFNAVSRVIAPAGIGFNLFSTLYPPFLCETNTSRCHALANRWGTYSSIAAAYTTIIGERIISKPLIYLYQMISQQLEEKFPRLAANAYLQRMGRTAKVAAKEWQDIMGLFVFYTIFSNFIYVDIENITRMSQGEFIGKELVPAAILAILSNRKFRQHLRKELKPLLKKIDRVMAAYFANKLPSDIYRRYLQKIIDYVVICSDAILEGGIEGMRNMVLGRNLTATAEFSLTFLHPSLNAFSSDIGKKFRLWNSLVFCIVGGADGAISQAWQDIEALSRLRADEVAFSLALNEENAPLLTADMEEIHIDDDDDPRHSIAFSNILMRIFNLFFTLAWFLITFNAVSANDSPDWEIQTALFGVLALLTAAIESPLRQRFSLRGIKNKFFPEAPENAQFLLPADNSIAVDNDTIILPKDNAERRNNIDAGLS